MNGVGAGRAGWPDSRSVTLVLGGVAWAVYAIAFRMASFDWVDALGASGAHVLPGAAAGRLAWWAQDRVGTLRAALAVPTHVLLALATSGLWLVSMLGITALAKPEALAHVVRDASQATLLLGLVLYGSVAFVHALVRAREREARREAARVRAELRALRARVEPHFLYNTLESIASLVRSDPGLAENAIVRLGRLLRGVLDEPDRPTQDALVPLADELCLVHDYLEIERLRMGERLRVVECVADHAGDFAVPRFVLQTLVENAVVHGLAARREGGTISLSAHVEGERLVLVVADDGTGASERTLREGGLGLALLRQRLALHFAGDAGIDVAAAEDQGVSVRLSLPAVEAS